MAGYFTRDEGSGERVNLPYERPFVVRAAEINDYWAQHVTVTAFRTQEEADVWVEKNRAIYAKGIRGQKLWVENWNL